MRHRTFRGVILSAGMAVVAGALGFFASERLSHEEFRLLSLMDWDTDLSTQGRGHLNTAAWNEIKENPLFGNYGHYVADNPEGVAAYAHNILSAWVNGGLFGFILYLSCVVIGVLALIQGWSASQAGSRSALLLAAMLWVFVGLGFLVSKAYLWAMFGVACGATARLREITVVQAGNPSATDWPR